MSDTSSTPNSELEEQWQRWVDAALPDDDDDSPPPLHADPARSEIESQRQYITALEQLAVGGGAKTSEPPGTALTLRQQNKLLVTKSAALQRQLQAAHAASRSAQQVNAQWRSEHRNTREREREHYAQLQAALEKPNARSGCRRRTRASARSSESATSSSCRAADASPSSSNWSSRCERSSANRCVGLRWRAWSQIRRCCKAQP